MTGLEPGISGVGSDRSSNCASTAAILGRFATGQFPAATYQLTNCKFDIVWHFVRCSEIKWHEHCIQI